MPYMSAVKSSENGLVYVWGGLCGLRIRKFAICEYTNIFDMCNSRVAQSPIYMDRVYTNEEFIILNDLKAAFNDRVSFILYCVYLSVL